MIVRIGGFAIEVNRAITYRHYQEIIKLASMTAQLQETERLIIDNAVSQNTKEVRRLEEKQRRLVRRIDEQRNVVKSRK